MWVIDMTHSKDAMKSEFHDRNFRFLRRFVNFFVGGSLFS